jgi:hypothetical protein
VLSAYRAGCCPAVRTRGRGGGGGGGSRDAVENTDPKPGLLYSHEAESNRIPALTAGDGETARYRNSPPAALGLVEGRPDFMGGVYDLNYDRSDADMCSALTRSSQGCMTCCV